MKKCLLSLVCLLAGAIFSMARTADGDVIFDPIVFSDSVVAPVDDQVDSLFGVGPSVQFIPVKSYSEVDSSLADEIFLRAIRIRECGDRSDAVGKYGERGAYQFRYRTWRQHSKSPFINAHRAEAHVVARKHLDWLRRSLVRAGYKPTPYNIALCWNAGFASVVSGKFGRPSIEYAQDVENLYTSFLASSY